MWPWGHLAVAYLAFRVLARVRTIHSPTGQEVWLLAFGALLPDLVDKTFSWTIPILENGRSLTHSFLTLILVGLLLHWLLDTPANRVRAGAFYLGWVSHPIADAIPGLLAGDIQAIFFWNWPFGPHPIYTTDPSYIAHFAALGQDLVLLSQGQFGQVGFTVYELLLVAVVLVIWVYDGAPGIGYLQSVAHNVYTRTIAKH